MLVGRVHRGVAEALQYARSLRPHHLVALRIADEGIDHAEVERDWARFGFDVPLEIVDSPYRELTAPVNRYLDRLDARWSSDRLTVVIPEFVVGVRSPANVLHGQNALALKLSLLERPNTAVAAGGARIATLPVRARVKVTGEITGTRVVPRASSPWLELTIDDGSGSFVAMYTGRRTIPGLHPGRVVECEGVLREERGRRVMLNPAYTLVADSAGTAH